MALKFEIIGNNLVVTDTADNSVKLERPAADVYAICETDKFKLVTRTDRNDILLTKDYTGLVDSANTGFSKDTFTNFCRHSLGALKQGGFTFIDPDMVPIKTAAQVAQNVSGFIGSKKIESNGYIFEAFVLAESGWDCSGLYVTDLTTSAIQDAFTLAKNLGIASVNLLPGKDYEFDTPVTWDIAYCAINPNRARIMVNTIAENTTVWTWDYNPPESGGYRNLLATLNMVVGMAIINPNVRYEYPRPATGGIVPGTRAMYFNGTDVQAGLRMSLYNVMLSGFEILIDGKDRWYLTKLHDPELHNFECAIRQQAGTDAGENCSISGGTISQGNLAFYLLDGSSEWFISGATSIDYTNQLCVTVGSPSRLHLSLCHVEPRGASVSGDPSSTSVLLGTGTDPRAYVPGRDNFIDIDGVGSYFCMEMGWLDPNNSGGNGPYAWQDLVKVRNKSALAIFRGVAMDNLGNVNNSFWSGRGTVIVEDTQIKHSPSGAGMPTRLSTESRANLLLDGNINDSAIIDDWFVFADTAAVTNRLTGTNITIARSTAFNYNPNGSLLLTKVGAGTGRAAVLVPCKPGALVSLFGRAYRANGGPAGNIFAEIRFCKNLGRDSNGVPIVRQRADLPYRSATQLTNTTGAWTNFEIKLTEEVLQNNSVDAHDRCPPGCDSALIVFNCDAVAAGAAVYLDDLWVSSW
jgi:hypothetical protein